MPRGSKPGERRGGRKKGTPNRSTLERQRELSNVVGADACAGRLGKEVLAEAMGEFYALAMRYHPGGREPDEAKFTRYLKLASDIASDLAPYQSPKLAQTTPRSDQEDDHLTAEEATAALYAELEDLGILPPNGVKNPAVEDRSNHEQHPRRRAGDGQLLLGHDGRPPAPRLR